jgi:hypothetical protein
MPPPPFPNTKLHISHSTNVPDPNSEITSQHGHPFLLSSPFLSGTAHRQPTQLPPPKPTQQPLRQADDSTDISVASFLDTLDRMSPDSAALVKLKHHQALKLLLVADVSAEPFRDLVDPLTASDAAEGGSDAEPASLALGAKADDELLSRIGRGRQHSFGEDGQPDVGEEGQPAPCHWCCPEGGVVGYSAGDGGEVRVGRGKEVKGYAG